MPGNVPIQTASNSISGVTLQGRVHGGQSPIVGAHVYLEALLVDLLAQVAADFDPHQWPGFGGGRQLPCNNPVGWEL